MSFDTPQATSRPTCELIGASNEIIETSHGGTFAGRRFVSPGPARRVGAAVRNASGAPGSGMRGMIPVDSTDLGRSEFPVP